MTSNSEKMMSNQKNLLSEKFLNSLVYEFLELNEACSCKSIIGNCEKSEKNQSIWTDVVFRMELFNMLFHMNNY